MLSPSDIVVRPASLAERLAAEVPAVAPALPEQTPTTMAERFAPEAQKGVAECPGRPLIEPAALPGLIPEPARASSANRWLVLTSIFVSLVPTAVILALLWQGAIKIPGSSGTPIVFDQAHSPESKLASVAAVPAAPPAIEVEAKPEIALTAPGRIEASTGDELAFTIAIDSADALPARSVIAIRALPEGAAFSQGRPYGATEWSLRPDEIGDLRLRLPKTASSGADLRVELMAADGTILASASTRIDIAPDPRAALILRADESGRVADLISHGHKMIDVGYFAGARAYFRRAAEAGSGEAALLLAATYDQEFIDKIGAHGIKADPKEARAWYERAKQLGVEDAEAKFKALKEDRTDRQEPAQATEAEVVTPALASAEPAGESGADDASGAEVSAASPVASAPLPVAKEEWVALVGYANVRAAPSTTADTLRVAEKGAKLRVTGRQGNWVQVTDPATAEVGWVYSRYIETAQSPTQ
jgi:Bacterial SH3 domain